MSKQIPNHLKHKPIYVLENYSPTDGQYKNKTDVIGLSLGRAQWCDSEFIPSVKVWRRKNNRWSRQSEETTLTRALDLATMVVKIVDAFEHNKEIEPIRTLYGSMNIEEVAENAYLKEGLTQFLKKQDNINDIKAHIDILYEALKTYKKDSY